MRVTSSDPRPAGYPVAMVLFLVAPWCALAGSAWTAAGLGLAGTVLLVLLARVRGPARRRQSGPVIQG